MLESSNPPFFVYGTLLPGQPNDFLWAEMVVSHEPAVLANGRLYNVGHYPMLLEEGDEPVQGRLLWVKSEAYAELVACFDHLEGYDPAQPGTNVYQREVREVQLVDGRLVMAWVYMGQPRYVTGLLPVVGGDWATYVAEMTENLRTWWAGVESVSGLLD